MFFYIGTRVLNKKKLNIECRQYLTLSVGELENVCSCN
jgi:hypothetical protein